MLVLPNVLVALSTNEEVTKSKEIRWKIAELNEETKAESPDR